MSDLKQMELPELISSAEGSRAKTSAAPASKPASMARAPVYGPSLPELLAKYDRDTRSWRTSQHCLLETAAGGLAEYSETWPRSGMTRSGIAYQLPPLARLTDETECGSWPTPRANDAEKRGNIANDPRNGLPAAVRWATPVARDWKGPGMSKARLQTRSPDNLSSQVRALDGSGSLNPMWVEWLMGFPIGHTDLEDWVTPSSRKSRK